MLLCISEIDEEAMCVEKNFCLRRSNKVSEKMAAQKLPGKQGRGKKRPRNNGPRIKRPLSFTPHYFFVINTQPNML